MREKKQLRVLKIIKEHVINNKKEYVIIFLIFVVGIFSGVFFVNHLQETPKTEISNYLNQFIEKFKGIDNINRIELLKNSVIQNIGLAIIIWFFRNNGHWDTHCFCNYLISRILSRIYHLIMYYYYGIRKRA